MCSARNGGCGDHCNSSRRDGPRPQGSRTGPRWTAWLTQQRSSGASSERSHSGLACSAVTSPSARHVALRFAGFSRKLTVKDTIAMVAPWPGLGRRPRRPACGHSAGTASTWAEAWFQPIVLIGPRSSPRAPASCFSTARSSPSVSCRSTVAAQRDHVHRRPERLRQDHVAALHRRPHRSQRRRAPGRTASRSPAPPDGVAMVFQHFGLLPWKTVYDNAAFGLAMAGAPAARHQRARRALSRTGRAHRLRAALSLSALRRHAAARRPRARARHEPVDPADGRAVRRARRADPRNPAGGTAAAHGAAGRAQDHGVHHPFDRRGDPARRPHRGDERASRPHQGSARHAVRPAARRRRGARRSALRRVARCTSGIELHTAKPRQTSAPREVA